MIELLQNGRRVSIEEAKRLSAIQPVMVWWRPEERLEEKDQYALVYGE